MKTVRLDDPAQAEAYLQHRAALIAILNNADGYVTIDGDPGSYPGARAKEFLKVFLADQRVLRSSWRAAREAEVDSLDLVRLGNERGLG